MVRCKGEWNCRKCSLHLHGRAAPVSDIQFFKPKIGHAPPEVNETHGHTIPTFTDEQVSSFLHQVKEIAPNTLLLSSLTDSEDTDSALRRLPRTLHVQPGASSSLWNCLFEEEAAAAENCAGDTGLEASKPDLDIGSSGTGNWGNGGGQRLFSAALETLRVDH
ncbi:hypothetical protein MTO96_027938 [Rhipicephalus appendiculatus]